MGLLMLFGVQQVEAFDPEDLKRLFVIKPWAFSNSCPACDLQAAYLRGADLEYAYLREANFRHAKLQGADLWKANLEGANLDPQGIKRAKASGAINVPGSTAVVKKTTPYNPEHLKKLIMNKYCSSILIFFSNIMP